MLVLACGQTGPTKVRQLSPSSTTAVPTPGPALTPEPGGQPDGSPSARVTVSHPSAAPIPSTASPRPEARGEGLPVDGGSGASSGSSPARGPQPAGCPQVRPGALVFSLVKPSRPDPSSLADVSFVHPSPGCAPRRSGALGASPWAERSRPASPAAQRALSYPIARACEHLQGRAGLRLIPPLGLKHARRRTAGGVQGTSLRQVRALDPQGPARADPHGLETLRPGD